MAYVKPVRPVIVIAANKAAEFEALKPNREVIEKMKKISALVKENNKRNFK